MTETYIQTGNGQVPASQAGELPDRKFREAWVLDGAVIAIDEAKAANIQRARIKEEANRRIEAVCPEWKQRNLLAQANILNRKGEANWTQAEADAWAAGEALWGAIAALRTKSDELEALGDAELVALDVEADATWASEV